MSFGPASVAARLAALLPGYPDVAIAVAVSGGADSAALLHALAAARGAAAAPRLRALHVDHGLQAAAADLRAAAADVAAVAGVALAVLEVRVEASGTGVEAAAREARYAALAGALAPDEALLTAHHAEDQAETLLLQLLRGAGLRGLAAMPAVAALGRGQLVRPLLDVPRAELVAYAGTAGLRWCDDPMNVDPRRERAYVRAAVWPTLVARWPAAAATLGRAARHAAEGQALLDALADDDLATLGGGAWLAVAPLLALPAPRRTNALRRWLARRGVRPPPARRLELVERELLRSRASTGPRLAWDDAELRRFGDRLYLVTVADAPAPHAALHPAAPLALGRLGRLELRHAVGEGLAAGRVALPLAVRPRAGGERLRLRADAPRRALKDLLREARVPPWVRERAAVVWDAGRVVAVALPGATWIDAGVRAGADEAAYALSWRDAPDEFVEAAPPFR